ncbi:O-antigen ligase family protein [Endothiovibrio diazotrophicus]
MLRTIYQRAREGFFSHGLLIPAFLPLAQVSGRALVDLLLVIYLAWALVACAGRTIRGGRTWLWLYLLVLLALGASIPGAADLHGAIKSYYRFVLQSAVMVFTLIALQQSEANLQRLVRAFAVAGVLMVVQLYLLLPGVMAEPGFDPALALKEDSLPLFAPFVLLWLAGFADRRLRWGGLLALAPLAFGYIVYSQGRAALLGMLVAVLGYLLLVKGWRRRTALVVAAGVLMLSAALSYTWFFRDAQVGTGVQQVLDRFTSGRTELWRHAFAHPPENPLTGIGMGNLKEMAAGDQVLMIHVKGDFRVNHLHNFLMDLWYETGLLGLGATLLFFGHLAWLARRAWIAGGDRERRIVGACVAAAAAILAAALLSFSYGSRQFSLYLFTFLAVIIHLAQRPNGGAERR